LGALTKSCAVPKGSVFSKYILRMHDPHTAEALLIQEIPTENEIFGSTVFTEVFRR
jgi:hypothetical protein